MYRPLPLDSIALNQPVLVNIWDPKGVLLLRKGETITSEQHRSTLMLHGPLVLASELAECGLACIAMIARFHGHDVDLNGLRQRFALSLSGMSLRSLMGLADQLGIGASDLFHECRLRRTGADDLGPTEPIPQTQHGDRADSIQERHG